MEGSKGQRPLAWFDFSTLPYDADEELVAWADDQFQTNCFDLIG
jgi:hypothetical protein